MSKKPKADDPMDELIDLVDPIDGDPDPGPVYVDPIEAKITEALAAAEVEFGRELTRDEIDSIRTHTRDEHNIASALADDEKRLAFVDVDLTDGSVTDRLLQTLCRKSLLSWADVKHIVNIDE